MRLLVIADGDVPSRDALDAAWPGWSDAVEPLIAADGGAAKAGQLGLQPDLVVGDLDSLAPDALARLEAAGVAIERVPAAKDESDTELACLRAVERGATEITILGALGGRFDHALANVWLLALPAFSGRSVQLLDAVTRVRLLSAVAGAGGAARIDLSGPAGDLVTLLPFGDEVEGVCTEGLLYPLRDEPLRPGPSRGLSNVREAREASVSIRAGRLLVIETRTGGRGNGNLGNLGNLGETGETGETGSEGATA